VSYSVGCQSIAARLTSQIALRSSTAMLRSWHFYFADCTSIPQPKRIAPTRTERSSGGTCQTSRNASQKVAQVLSLLRTAE
jgi:hypothetical protein